MITLALKKIPTLRMKMYTVVHGCIFFVSDSILLYVIHVECNKYLHKGPFNYYLMTKGWLGGSENVNFPLLYTLKM